MSAIFFALLCSVLWQGQVRDQPSRRDEPSPGAVSISGRVQAVGTGAPIQGAVIVLVTAPIMESHSSGRDAEAARIDGRSAMTDASGGFSFTGVAPGSYRLIVT
ncbi:MAG TPA: carboxypeptidase-like regulatory domain-containing protein, partial [Vicinamibacterales bacterium]|nr:carboxypeptidase-like regulatory domain-containing protein [Vicinamibacterales bacterium]